MKERDTTSGRGVVEDGRDRREGAAITADVIEGVDTAMLG